MATVDELRKVLADTFQLYIRAHTFHWNVTGLLFTQYHAFFETIYKDTWEEIDAVAEHIRACGELAPASVTAILSVASAPEQHTTPGTTAEMVSHLAILNGALLDSLTSAHTVARQEQADGVVNFLEGLLDSHQKLQWQLEASLV